MVPAQVSDNMATASITAENKLSFAKVRPSLFIQGSFSQHNNTRICRPLSAGTPVSLSEASFHNPILEQNTNLFA
jgi:hypothetical protein